MSDELPNLRADPRALRVCKKPIPVRVEFATADGTCTTLEGPVRYRAGDAILTGVRSEHVGSLVVFAQYSAKAASLPAVMEAVWPRATRAGSSGRPMPSRAPAPTWGRPSRRPR